ncbi:SDR family oxidoreductase [Paenibacillus glycanilyticus]|uniref:NmrA family transcriptional regulator n=1 Tax=Paenibacillus glycanilyticus TaxID=126569 RepID=A0ABQ6GFS5_9BACL|nr:SDR family oxidoreductase [Paenibacillus glycanilyticus]GLX69811.1 NmrA family transcriptional regulator [Paenibacillus glycanilyticus]
MIIITGASGQFGRLVVNQLLERVPAEQLGVSVRDTSKVKELEERGVRVRRGDYNDADSLMHAFEGASQFLIVSSDSLGETALQHHRTAIEVATKAGAKHIYYSSQMGASKASLFPPMVDHAVTEEVLRTSGVAFTSLRNGFYAGSALMMLGDALETGVLAAPEDGPVAWTTHADLAEAAAIMMSEEGPQGITPVLTGSATVDLAGIAAMASELTGRPIRRMVITDEEYRAGLLAHGLPEERADMFVGLFLATRNGEFDRTDKTLAQLLGREPIGMKEVLKAAIAERGTR